MQYRRRLQNALREFGSQLAAAGQGPLALYEEIARGGTMDGGVPFSAFLHAAKARLPQGLDEADIAVMLGVSKRGSLLDVGLSRADFVRAFGKGSVPWNGPNFHAPSSAEGWSSLAVRSRLVRRPESLALFLKTVQLAAPGNTADAHLGVTSMEEVQLYCYQQGTATLKYPPLELVSQAVSALLKDNEKADRPHEPSPDGFLPTHLLMEAVRAQKTAEADR